MKKGKYAKRRGAASRVLVMLLAIVMIVGISVGGTLAWLSAKTTEVKNVFTDSDIEAGLEETERQYKMVPGWSLDKDPVAWVTAESEDCYLFIEVVEAGGAVTYKNASGTEVTTTWSDFLNYTIAEGWEKLSGEGPGKGTSVYYRIFEADDQENTNVKGTKYPILSGNKVNVDPNVTKEMMDAVNDTNKPTLSFTAYAVQLNNSESTEFTAAEAWGHAQSAVAPAETTEATAEPTP